MKNENMTFTTIPLLLGCFAISTIAQAVVPAPDGAYPGGNTAEGQTALFSLTSGGYNTAIGYYSLVSDTNNSFNTAIGAGSLLTNTADQNTATGAAALLSNTTGTANTANGAFALLSNTTGYSNSAFGKGALASNTTGSSNTANGYLALYYNTTGDYNTAIGYQSLFSNTTGSNNTALGVSAGIGITTAFNAICIGSGGADVSNSCFIGNIRGVTTQNADAIPVLIDSAGQLGTISSSRRFKKEIKPMDCASEALLSLKPVTFQYKSDKTGAPQFGLIAEEVAEINPDLVVHDENGEIYTVRYEAVNAMLLNEFLKEHRRVDQQARQLQKQAATMAMQQKTIEVLAAGLQKVSDELELRKPMPRTVANHQ